MERRDTLLAARGLTDARDRLISADGPLAELQESCGGELPGVLAVPELLGLVQQGRGMGLKIARDFCAFDGAEIVTGFVRIHPLSEEEGGGCELLVENWQRSPAASESSRETAERLDAIDRATAEVNARLDARQRVQFVNASARDAGDLAEAIAAQPAQLWTDYVELHGVSHQQPMHWRLLDGAQCTFDGSERKWRVRLLPIGPVNGAPQGFELLLVSDQLLPGDGDASADVSGDAHSRLIGSALTPVLRQPIARIIANAETIRARLAGPLKADYSEYAGNIAAAGQHLSGMLDDLADLEVVEAPDFQTAKDLVDLADVAGRAAGILGVRAQNRGISLNLRAPTETCFASAEFRRVLQIMINLIGNAIAYSPENSVVTIRVEPVSADAVALTVSDEGPGIDTNQAERIFDKFERLGRDSDGGNDTGSGLGLYISRRLALAMEGDLTVENRDVVEGATGAVFTLTLPSYI